MARQATTPPLRTAVIGLGSFGSAHLRALRESGRFDVRIACDSDQFALDYIHVDDPDLDLTLDWRRIVEMAGDLEAVVVALPHDLYAEIVPTLLDAGLHVLMEKPFGRTLAEARLLGQAAERNGRTLMVGGQNKFTAGFRRARRVVSDRLLGDIFLVRGTTVYQWGKNREWDWRASRERSGGVAVLDAGWHILEQIVAFKGVPEKVYAAAGTTGGVGVGDHDVDDRVALILHYADGTLGQVLSCFVTTPFEWRVSLHGVHGSLELQQHEIRLDLEGSPPSVERIESGDAMKAQADHFATAIRSGIQTYGSPSQALHVMQVVDAAYRSIASGQPELVDTAQ